MTDPSETPIEGASGEAEEEKKPHAIVRTWRLGKRIKARYDYYTGWYDRFVSWHDWLRWIITLFKTKAGVAVVGAVGTAAAVGTVAVVKPELLPKWPRKEPPVVIVEAPPAPPRPQPQPQPKPAPVVVAAPTEPAPPAPTVTVKAERWNANIVAFPISGKDSLGRAADFEIAVLTREFTWLRSSAEQLTHNDKPMTPEDLSAMVFGPSTQTALSDALGIIAVGVASAEGAQVNEAERARKRAETSRMWLATTVASVAPPIPMWSLNLGQYRTACKAESGSADTSWQRPYMMIAVRKQDADVKLDEALKDAMTGKKNVPSPSCYSAFELKPGQN